MKKPFNPNFEILTANLGDAKQDYNHLLDLTGKFKNENSKIDKYNKLEYDVLYRSLGNFYKLVVNTSHLDLDEISLKYKLLYAERKNFSLEIKDSLRESLVDLEKLQHFDEVSPFYDEALLDEE